MGGGLRVWLGDQWNHLNPHIPYGTLMANVLGSLCIGISIGLLHLHFFTEIKHLFFATGFCGGLTTFSTFTLETFKLFHKKKYSYACVYWGGSVVLTILSFFIGIYSTMSLFN